MKLTWIDLNSWLFYLGGKTILVDPWLVDPLEFYGLPWLFTAYHNTPLAVTPDTLPAVDLILLSQGVDDHCHKPTLQQLDRSIPVVASPTAAKVVRSLGYQQVTELAHWQAFQVGEKVKITSVLGAEIQPGQVESGYLLQDLTTNETLYYEPHQAPVQELAARIGRVDVAIAPVIGQIFPLLGQVIMGPEQALQLVETVHPRYFLPTTRGDIRATGILPMLTKSVGSVEEFRDRLSASGLSTQLLVPAPGEMVEIPGPIGC
ncbi:MBL fold metallo-hydrolase [Leptothermofonsia sichuanensis E412]|uniref:MBL fold metallo-hydrolase n=1 Tax=Leptothermofonsia sichuanensis TaxID=2917832 RepID=UPI001CA7B472|nr:MBL fold metallo-hydrolase [Leptothermofonsia sichuanensis]QZZ20558.1 MBL fold metallo-hydrolase [Leptothermofonsia sichuanensis E412]